MRRAKLVIISLFFMLILINSYLSAQAYPNLYKVTGNPEFVPPISTADPKAFQTDLFTGTAVFNYPIFMPEGTAGVKPTINVSYESGGTNSLLGYGWNIFFGAIERSTKYGVPKYNSEDTFMLNGQELVLQQGESLWHTKLESFKRIIKNPYDWIVTDKNGIRSFYGQTTNSRLSSPSGIAKWLIDKVEDSQGNYFEIEYDQASDSGWAYPITITYTKNEVADISLTKFRTVEFVYEDRPDIILNYRRGYLEKIGRRLKEIIIKIDNQLVRKYVFDYVISPESGRSLLKSITEIGNDNATTLPPTTFDYGYNRNKGFSHSSNWTIPVPLAYSNGSDNGARVVDLNGDGLVDIIKCREGSSLQVFINDGTRWIEDEVNWRLPSEIYFATSGNRDTGVRLSDINGDGLVDILKYKEGSGPPKAYLNNGAGWGPDDSNWHPPAGLYFTSSSGGDKGVRLLDINGDSKIDLLKFIEGSSPKTYMSNGNTWELKPEWDSPLAFAFSNGKDKGVRHTDLNNDGLIDVIKGFVGVSKLAEFNNGKGWTSDMSDWHTTEMFTASSGTDRGVRLVDINNDGQVDILKFVEGSVSKAYIRASRGWREDNNWASPEPFIFSNGRSKSTQFGDVNGDGLLDILKYLEGSTSKVYLNRGSGDVDRKIKINNSIGGIFEIEYLNSCIRHDTKIPFPILTVKKVTRKDGRNHSSTTWYNFSGGMYDFDSKEFRGFEKVEVTNPDGAITNKYFHQDQYKKGKLYREVVADNQGLPYTEKIYTFEEGGSVANVKFIFLSEEKSILYNPSSGMSVKSGISYIYDSYGNLTLKQYQGDINIIGDELEDHIEYIYNTARWILSLPSHLLTLDESGQKIKESWRYYDGLPLGEVVKGNLTKEVHWNNQGENLIIKRTYDDFGNLLTETDPEGYRLGRTPAKTITYDTDYHTFPQTIKDAKGFLNVYKYDAGIGEWVEKRYPNGAKILRQFDQLGRLNKVIGPKDLTSPNGSVLYEYFRYGEVGHQRLRISHTVEHGENEVLWNEIFFDGFGRTFKQVFEGESGNDIYQEIEYNERGLQHKVSIDHFNNEPQEWTVYEYDPLGRVTRINLPNESSLVISYNLREKIVEDPLGKIKIYSRDAYNNVTKVTERNGNTDYLTYYEYDKLGNLVKVTDHHDNVTNIVFNSLGKKTSIEDPDIGKWKYLYDLNSNLIEKTDNKNQKISFEYDELNRIRTKEYPDGSSEIYQYDLISSPECGCGNARPFDVNMRAKLAMVTDNSGITKFKYDELGRVIEVQRIIDGKTYKILTTYDALNRVKSIIYPDGEEIITSYNEAGLVKSISGNVQYVKSVEYWSSGQIKRIKYGNDFETTFNYDLDNLFLKSIETLDTDGNIAKDLQYIFDASGKVTSIVDAARGNTQEFEYDDLYRLISATGNYGTINLTFDAIGNITTKNGISYDYDSSRPHAVTSTTANLAFNYDLNGNMIDSNDFRYDYDYNNQITKIYKKESSEASFELVTQYVYDYQGERVKKIQPDKSITYLGQLAEIDGSLMTKYVYFGSKRIAAITSEFTSSNQNNIVGGIYGLFKNSFISILVLLIAFTLIFSWHKSQKNISYILNLRKLISLLIIFVILINSIPVNVYSKMRVLNSLSEIYYFHKNHQETTVLVSNQSGSIVARYEYLPFGGINRIEGTDIVNHKFTDQQFEKESDLYFFISRYYDSELGRFLKPDTVIPDPLDPQSLNRYSYVRNNPINLMDPSGEGWIGTIIGAFFGGFVGGFVTVYAGPVAGAAVGGFVGGFIIGAFEGRDFKSAIIGGAIGAAAGAAGGWLASQSVYLTYGITAAGMTYSAIEGGSQGFAEGVVGSLIGSGAFVLGYASGMYVALGTDLSYSSLASDRAAQYAENEYADGSTKYNKDQPGTSKDYWKCNIFVGDAYTKGGGLRHGGPPGTGYPTNAPRGKWYPLANYLANSQKYSDYFSTLSTSSQLMRGDIVAFPSTSGSGHVAVYVGGGHIVSAKQFGLSREALWWANIKYYFAGRNSVYRQY